MKLWLRLVWALATWRSRGSATMADVGVRNFRVWPTDIDVFMHMNNGIYFTLLDLARLDLMKRAQVWQRLKRKGVHPVVVQETITFRKSLLLWQRFTIETKIIGWDSQAFFIQQRYVVAGEIYAEALVKVRFLQSPRGVPTPEEINEMLGGWPGAKPKLPGWVSEWNSAVALPKGKEPAPSTWPGN